jgi:hypothetical protein
MAKFVCCIECSSKINTLRRTNQWLALALALTLSLPLLKTTLPAPSTCLYTGQRVRVACAAKPLWRRWSITRSLASCAGSAPAGIAIPVDSGRLEMQPRAIVLYPLWSYCGRDKSLHASQRLETTCLASSCFARAVQDHRELQHGSSSGVDRRSSSVIATESRWVLPPACCRNHTKFS